MVTFNCLDGQIALNNFQFEKFEKVPFFKEVVCLDIDDELEVDVHMANFKVIIDFICDPFNPTLKNGFSMDNFKEIANYAEFYQIKILIFTIRNWLNRSFVKACETGNLNHAQKLFSTNWIKSRAHEDLAFRRSCKNGHLHMAQWLLEIDPSIDIHAKENRAFLVSCRNGHLHIAQWLLNLDCFGLRIRSGRNYFSQETYLNEIIFFGEKEYFSEYFGENDNFYGDVDSSILKRYIYDLGENAVYQSYINNHLHVVQWLLYSLGIKC